MRRTKEEAEATRRAVLRAALEQFSEQGYAAARLSDVAEAAGVTRGAIYHHFENKAGLYGALLEKYAGAFGEQVMEAIGEGGTFLEICRRVFVRPLAALEADPAFAAFYELVQFHTFAIPELQAAHERQAKGDEAMLQNIAGYFQMGRGRCGRGWTPATWPTPLLPYRMALFTCGCFASAHFPCRKRPNRRPMSL